jgi:hypothetical protein
MVALNRIPLSDRVQRSFEFTVPVIVQEELHKIIL